MRSSTILKLLTILVLLSAVLAAQRYLLPQLKPPSPYLKTVSQLSPDQVDEIVLKNQESQLTLNKKDSSWTVNDLPAKDQQITSLLQTLLKPQNPQLIAQTSAKHSKLGVDSSQATQIIFKNSDKSLSPLLVSTSGSNTYVRLDDKDPVYSLGSPPKISTDPQDWYDLTVTQLNSADITQIIVTHPQETFTLEKKDDQWIIKEKNQSINQQKVDRLTSSLALLSAQSLEVKKSPQDLPNPQTTLEIKIKDQPESLTLRFIPQDPTQKSPDFYIIKSADPRIFLVNNYTATPFLTLLSDYLTSP